MKKIMVSVVTVIFLALTGAGCSIHQLTHDGLEPLEETRTGTVAVAESAEGFTGGRVGWGRVTLFAIPVVPVRIHGDESIQLMENIQEALALSGYGTTTVSSDSAGEPLVLQAKVTNIRYNNYTWLVPLIPTWGGISVTLSLVDESGDVLWSDHFEGKGATLNFTDGYNIDSQKSMRRMLNDMTSAFISDEFYRALHQHPMPPLLSDQESASLPN